MGGLGAVGDASGIGLSEQTWTDLVKGPSQDAIHAIQSEISDEKHEAYEGSLLP